MSDDTTLTSILPALLSALGVALIVWVVLRLATRAVDGVASSLRREGLSEEGAVFAARLTRFFRSSLWLIAVLAAGIVMLRGLGLLGVPPISTDDLLAWLVGPGLRVVLIATSAYLVTRAIHFLIDSLQILLLSRDVTQTNLLERKKRVDTIGQLLRIVSTLLVAGVAGLTVLSLFNVDIRPILTGAGVAGLAVGFGAQNLVRDVIAGFFLILENQVRLGDVVSINNKSGLVEAIRLRTIVLRGLDGTVHIIPNGVITELSNMTKDFSYAVLDIGIPYEEDVDRVMGILMDAAAELQRDPVHGPNILEALEALGVETLGESSVTLRVRIKTVPIQQWNVGRELRRRIKIAFEARGIDFARRAFTVRLQDVPASLGRAPAAEAEAGS